MEAGTVALEADAGSNIWRPEWELMFTEDAVEKVGRCIESHFGSVLETFSESPGIMAGEEVGAISGFCTCRSGSLTGVEA